MLFHAHINSNGCTCNEKLKMRQFWLKAQYCTHTPLKQLIRFSSLGALLLCFIWRQHSVVLQHTLRCRWTAFIEFHCLRIASMKNIFVYGHHLTFADLRVQSSFRVMHLSFREIHYNYVSHSNIVEMVCSSVKMVCVYYYVYNRLRLCSIRAPCADWCLCKDSRIVSQSVSQ